MSRPAVLPLVFASFGLACPSDDEQGGEPPFFPEDYAQSYREVRDCRPSGDHDLNNVRILADPDAFAPYQQRDAAFPLDAVVLKEEYDFGDLDCTGDVKQWTVMRKLAEGSAPETLGWSWQKVDAERNVVDPDLVRCVSCHQGCGVAPDGYDWTCAVP
jgi:hypothetical protein